MWLLVNVCPGAICRPHLSRLPDRISEYDYKAGIKYYLVLIRVQDKSGNLLFRQASQASGDRVEALDMGINFGVVGVDGCHLYMLAVFTLS